MLPRSLVEGQIVSLNHLFTIAAVDICINFCRSNGWSGFYKGIEAKLLQTILMAALMFTTYEHISRTVFKVMRASVQRKSWLLWPFYHPTNARGNHFLLRHITVGCLQSTSYFSKFSLFSSECWSMIIIHIMGHLCHIFFPFVSLWFWSWSLILLWTRFSKRFVLYSPIYYSYNLFIPHSWQIDSVTTK